MAKVRIRRYKRNPDFWEIIGGPKGIRNVKTMSFSEARFVAAARRRLMKKYGER